MISETMVRKRNLLVILGNYCMNYLKEFDLYVDIVLILYMFYVLVIKMAEIKLDDFYH